eukprot:TRINITY_DN3821_c0_g1_i1.p1 TRINITY_DN3821_c0_g1~~TRINITY_DN3821_c0_g1_i1.p1  ORF type:complete len:635 (-),score=80.33 TRINITY_DN3821_c0_g1_i1:224-2128(-)
MEKYANGDVLEKLTSVMSVQDISRLSRCSRHLNEHVWKSIRHWDFEKPPLIAINFMYDRFLAEGSRLSSISCALDRDFASSGPSERFLIKLAESGRLVSAVIRSARPTFVEELFSAWDPENVRLLQLHVAYNNATIPFIVQCVNLEHLFFRAMHPDNWKEFVDALSEGSFPQLKTLKISLELQQGSKGGQIHDLKKAFKKCLPHKLQRLDIGRPDTVARLLKLTARGKSLEDASRSLLAVPVKVLQLDVQILAEGAIEYIKTHLSTLDSEQLDGIFDALLQGEVRTSRTAHQILLALLNSLPYVLCVIEDFSPKACVVFAEWLRGCLEGHGSVAQDIDKWVDAIDTFERKSSRFTEVQQELAREMRLWHNTFHACMIEYLDVCNEKLKVTNRKYYVHALRNIARDVDLRKALLAVGDYPGGRPLWYYVDDPTDIVELMTKGMINPTFADKISKTSLVDMLCDPTRVSHSDLHNQFEPLISPTLKWVGENMQIDEAQSIFDRVRIKLFQPEFLAFALPDRRGWLLGLFDAIGSPATQEDISKMTRRFMKHGSKRARTADELLAFAITCFTIFPDYPLPQTSEEAATYVKDPDSFPFEVEKVVLEAAAEVARRRMAPNGAINWNQAPPSRRKCIIS